MKLIQIMLVPILLSNLFTNCIRNLLKEDFIQDVVYIQSILNKDIYLNRDLMGVVFVKLDDKYSYF